MKPERSPAELCSEIEQRWSETKRLHEAGLITDEQRDRLRDLLVQELNVPGVEDA